MVFAYLNREQILGIFKAIFAHALSTSRKCNKKLSYCWETVRRESMPRIAEMDVEITT